MTSPTLISGGCSATIEELTRAPPTLVLVDLVQGEGRQKYLQGSLSNERRALLFQRDRVHSRWLLIPRNLKNSNNLTNQKRKKTSLNCNAFASAIRIMIFIRVSVSEHPV